MVLSLHRRHAASKMWDSATIRRAGPYVDDDSGGLTSAPVYLPGGGVRVELAAGSTVGEQLTELAGWEAGVVGYLIHFEHFVDVRPGDEILVLRNGAWDSGDPNTYDRYIGAVPLPDETFNYDLTVAAHRVTPDV